MHPVASGSGSGAAVTAPALKVGDKAIHVERFAGREREVLRVKIVRETQTQWIDDTGDRWRKSDGALVPQYFIPRYLVTVATK